MNNFLRKSVGEKLWKNLLKIREKVVKRYEQREFLKTFFTNFRWKNESFPRFFHTSDNRKSTADFRKKSSVNDDVFHSFHMAYYDVLLFLIKKGARNNFAGEL
jgi:hypothetical protein